MQNLSAAYAGHGACNNIHRVFMLKKVCLSRHAARHLQYALRGPKFPAPHESNKREWSLVHARGGWLTELNSRAGRPCGLRLCAISPPSVVWLLVASSTAVSYVGLWACNIAICTTLLLSDFQFVDSLRSTTIPRVLLRPPRHSTFCSKRHFECIYEAPTHQLLPGVKLSEKKDLATHTSVVALSDIFCNGTAEP